MRNVGATQELARQLMVLETGLGQHRTATAAQAQAAAAADLRRRLQALE